MRSKKTAYGHLLSLDEGEELVKSFQAFCREQAIGSATFTGLGGFRACTLAFYDIASGTYMQKGFDSQSEVLNITGNVALFEGTPIIHVHAVLGRQDFSVIGGHLVEGTVRPMFEIHLFTDDGKTLREAVEGTSLKRLSF
ncbi:MAG: DUF296 domain-containing protein [DPANN group archaeon]|nr:DUF296 domain-containing protein [DPANN group archaeon]